MTLSSQKILIVEDDHDTRVAYRGTLEDEGYSVVTTTNGKTALEYLRRKSEVRLILLDLKLPIMDGNEFLSEKSGDTEIARIPVIVVTAVPDRVSHPVARILRKPINVVDLLHEVKQVFEEAAS